MARAVGAVAFWTTLESLFVVPADEAGWAAMAAGRAYTPLLPPAVAFVVNLAIAAGFVWWFALRPRVRRDPERRATFRLRAPAPGTWPWVAAAALAAAVAANATAVILPRFLRSPENNMLEAYARVPGGLPALLVLAALVAPLLEEFLFRGWLQGTLERVLRVWPAVLVTAAVFAAVHAEVFGLFPRFGLAVGAGYAAWRTRSIWPAVAMHATYNASLFAGGAVLPLVLPAPPSGVPMEAWADRDAALAYFWAHDPRVFAGAVAVLVAGAAAAAWALSRLPARAGDAADADALPRAALAPAQPTPLGG